MINRYLRFFLSTQKIINANYKEYYKSINIVQNSSNFTLENVSEIIDRLNSIYLWCEKEEGKKVIKQESIFHSAAANFSPLVKSLDFYQFISLILCAGSLKMCNSTLWSEIEKKIVTLNKDSVSKYFLIRIVMSLMDCYVKNDRIWEHIEKLILEYHSLSSKFNATETRVIIFSFAFMDKGSKKFFDTMVENFVKEMDNGSAYDTSRVIQGLSKIKYSNPVSTNAIIEKLLDTNYVPGLLIKNYSHVLKLNPNEQNIIKFENLILKNLENIEYGNWAKLPKIYYYNLPNKNDENRIKFLEKIEEYYSVNRPKIAEELKKKYKYSFKDIDFFWSLSKFNIFNKKDLWMDFLNSHKEIDGLIEDIYTKNLNQIINYIARKTR